MGGAFFSFKTFFIDYLKELKRVVNNIRARYPDALDREDWELFRQTIRILEICGKDFCFLFNEQKNFISSGKKSR